MGEIDFEIKRYLVANADEWDDFLDKSKNGLFLFKRDYMDYHHERFIDHSLVVFKKNKIYALLPASQKDTLITAHGGLTYGYLITNYNCRATEVIEIFSLIKAYYKSQGITELIYKPAPYIFHKYPADEDLYALMTNEATLFRRDISTAIDLSAPVKFSESKKQAVKKCAKSGVEIIQTNNLKDYWSLLTDVLKKFNTSPVHSLSEINDLTSKFPNHILLYEARLADELLAGIIVYVFDNIVHTQYMANSNKGRTLGALDFLNYYLIQLFSTSKKYYSFGISTENAGKLLNTGLIQQKEMMGGRAVTLDFYKFNL